MRIENVCCVWVLKTRKDESTKEEKLALLVSKIAKVGQARKT